MSVRCQCQVCVSGVSVSGVCQWGVSEVSVGCQ